MAVKLNQTQPMLVIVWVAEEGIQYYHALFTKVLVDRHMKVLPFFIFEIVQDCGRCLQPYYQHLNDSIIYQQPMWTFRCHKLFNGIGCHKYVV